MSTYLLAYLGTGTFRYLPYIYFSSGGDIIVHEYGQVHPSPRAPPFLDVPHAAHP